jgi:polar amino acid transport system substrate-binding protein
VKVTMAILDEPPFCWLGEDGATGADVDVATTMLYRIGVDDVDFVQVEFAELIPGLIRGRWQLNTGLFITEERRRLVRFTRPIWTVPDGLIVRRDRRFKSYVDIAADPTARLAVVAGQVQGDSARVAGIPDERILTFDTQEETVRAVRRGQAEAAASTAVGNRAMLQRFAKGLTAVELPDGGDGAFSAAEDLVERLDRALAKYLGTPEHRAVMTRYGIATA